MNYLDYIIIGVIILGFVLGFKDGLIRKIIGLLGLIVAIILVIEFAVPVGAYLTPFFNNENYLAEIVAGIVIFFLTILMVSIIKRIVHPLDKVNKFVNQLLGGISGVLQILFVLSAFLLMLNMFRVPSAEAKVESFSYNYVYQIIPTTVDFLLGDDSKTKAYIDDFIDGKNLQTLPDTLLDSLQTSSEDTNDFK